MKTRRICLWSSPRNVSTAMMYSFAQRPDTRVFDEPLYPHFLRVTGAERPDREATMAAMDTDGERVIREVILGPAETPVRFYKLMPHFLVDLDWAFLDECQHVLLSRNPAEILASYTKVITTPTMQDIGMEAMDLLCTHLQSRNKLAAVLDAEFVLRNPRKVLTHLCDALDLPFHEKMLVWPAGPRPEDGPWAKYWYENVHRSTGFAPYQQKEVVLPPHLEPLLQACLPPYERLRALALRP